MTPNDASTTSEQVGTQENPRWTFMLYLAGDNNLSYDMVWAVKELYSIKLPPNVAITAQFDPLVGSGTRFYLRTGEVEGIDIDGGFDRLGDIVRGEVNTGNPKVLATFIETSMRKAQADHYALILSGHGGGINGDFLTDYHPTSSGSHAGKDVLQNNKTAQDDRLEKGSLTIVELGQTLAEVSGKIEVLGMDSCLMSMAEVASQIGPQVEYLVASEGFVEATGWPYYRLLELLKRHVGGLALTPEKCAISLVNRCTNYYADFRSADVSFDLAACQIDMIKGVEIAVGEFVNEALKTERTEENKLKLMDSVLLAHWKAQSYKWELYTDLWDFFNELRKAIGERHELYGLCGKVTKAVEEAVKCSRFAGPQFQHSHGLSIYFPWSEFYYADDYEHTAFAGATGWHNFLRAYFHVTLRQTRSDEDRQYPEIPDGWEKSQLNKVEMKDGDSNGSRPLPINIRTNAPYGKTNAPYGKVFDLINVVALTRSRMKNPAGTNVDYLMLPKGELADLKKKIDDENNIAKPDKVLLQPQTKGAQG